MSAMYKDKCSSIYVYYCKGVMCEGEGGEKK